jgi:hypothetical protein
MAFAFWTETDTHTGAVSVFNLKAMLKLAGWTIPESSDGTTYNAAGDQISVGGSGAGGMANNSAWFRMVNPLGVEYVVQRGTTNLVWRVKCSPIDGFAGGSTATQVPGNATDEYEILGAGTDAAPTFETWFAADNGYRYKAGADSAAPFHFWSMAIPIGGGVTSHVFAHEGLVAVEPTDGAPFHVMIGNTDLILSPAFTTETEAGSSTRSYATRAQIVPLIADWTVMNGHSYNGVAVLAPLGSVVSPITSKDESFPILYGRRALASGGNPGYKGIGSMMRWLGLTKTNASTLTILTTRDRITFGDVSVPWQGTVPTV